MLHPVFLTSDMLVCQTLGYYKIAVGAANQNFSNSAQQNAIQRNDDCQNSKIKSKPLQI